MNDKDKARLGTLNMRFYFFSGQFEKIRNREDSFDRYRAKHYTPEAIQQIIRVKRLRETVFAEMNYLQNIV